MSDPRSLHWPRVAVVGAGAVGSYFGGMLARAGAPVTLIGRDAHVAKINASGLFIESIHFQETITVAATTGHEGLKDAGVVLLCVKCTDTEEAVRTIAGHLSSGAIVVSLQNGVDNVERIRAATGLESVAAAVYVAVELIAPGHIRHSGAGHLAVGTLRSASGDEEAGRRDAQTIAGLFAQAGVRCPVSDDIEAALWTKLVMNCAYNAISALGNVRYGAIAGNPASQEIIRQVVAEIVAVAGAAGVKLPPTDLLTQSALQLGETIANALSSTAQDIQRGKRTEIDSLNGYIVRRGREFGIATPVNQTLHGLVKLLEGAGRTD